MKIVFLFTLIVITFIFNPVDAQSVNDTLNLPDTVTPDNTEMTGMLLDYDTRQPLPYANIYVLHKNTGTISNENGHFLLNTNGLNKTDTVSFIFIGYNTRNLTIAQLDTTSVIYLKEKIFNLDEILVFGTPPDAKAIVKRIVENLDSNYSKTSCLKRLFIRERNTSELLDMKLDFKKSDIPELDENMISKIERTMPKNSTSFIDFLGNFYFSGREDDTLPLKVDPIKVVSLKDKNIARYDEIVSAFEDNLKNTEEGEYWKVKSGIFSQKLDMGADTGNMISDDTSSKNVIKLKYVRMRMNYQLKYGLLKNKDFWEFLYKTGKYKYTLAGGTRVNGEEVYIIDFEPDNSGMYKGRLFVSTNTYALIRADYSYAPGKTGTDFHLFGVGYTENLFVGSIYFEKRNNKYRLKYFSRKAGAVVDFDRNLGLVKKKERFLFDKKLNEIKVGVRLSVNSEMLFECLVLNDKPISQAEFDGFEEKKNMKIIYVDKFDDNLWKGYNIIEPTRQMRDYKKQLSVQE